MALTKVSRGLLSTGIVDNSNATAITLNADESATFAGIVSVGGITGSADGTLKVKSNSNHLALALEENSGNEAYQLGVVANGSLIFANSGTEVVRFDDSGNVGISTNNPQKTLDVQGEIAISNSATSYWNLNRDDSTGALTISDTGTQRFAITTAGSVGIGVSSPQRVLVLSKGDSTGVQTQYTNSTTGTAIGDGFTVGIDGSENAEFWNYSSTNMLFATSGTERARISSDGSFEVSSRRGIRFGNSTLQGRMGSSGGGYPTIGYNVLFTENSGSFGTWTADTAWRMDFGNNNRLQVHSRASAAASSTATYTAGPYVSLQGTSWTSSSDERLKESVSLITGATEKVKAMRPVNYQWKHDDKNANQLGFIAQEMVSIFPEVVDVPETETDAITGETLMWGITYDRLIPVLTAALQETLTKIETLEARITQLENN